MHYYCVRSMVSLLVLKLAGRTYHLFFIDDSSAFFMV